MRSYLLLCMVSLVAGKATNRAPCGGLTFPPLSCGADEQLCPEYMDPWIGCMYSEFCYPKSDGACAQHCPITCDWYMEKKCHADDPITGCPMPDMCISRNTADGCPNHCPVYCGPEETLCQDWVDPTSGCRLNPDYCMPNGTPCF